MPQTDPLVTTVWLETNLAVPDLRIVDASWHMPAQNRDAAAEFPAQHIPGAVFFDIDDISDQHTSLPHMLPSSDVFSDKMRALGLSNDSCIVVYDSVGIFSAPRVWWMFRAMGHAQVFVLDGGLPKWRAEGRAVHNASIEQTPGHFTGRQQSDFIRHIDQMIGNLTEGAEQVIDARSAGRFSGTELEPRPGLRSGHIPGSMNIHYRDLLNAAP